MSTYVLRLIAALGFGFSLAVIVGFITDSYILGIPHLIYEILGVTTFGFVCGYKRYAISVWCALSGTIIATMLDPAIWTAFDLHPPYDIEIFSAGLNGVLFILFIISYVSGGILKRRNG